MTRLINGLTLALLLAWLPGRAGAFSLLGPFSAGTWQVTPLGYNLPGDIGGPMARPDEGFRWMFAA